MMDINDIKESIEFANTHNALKVFYKAINLQKDKGLNPKESLPPRKIRISLTPRTNAKKIDFNSANTQSSILQPFMQTRSRKSMKKKYNNNDESLLNEFLIPKQQLDNKRKRSSTEQCVNSSNDLSKSNHRQIIIEPFNQVKKLTPKKTPSKVCKKFVDLNLFKKQKNKSHSTKNNTNSNSNQKQNRQINTPISIEIPNSHKNNHLQIQDILSKSYNRSSDQSNQKSNQKQQQNDRMYNSSDNIMNSQYFNLCQTYNSTQYQDKTQLSNIKQQQIQQSLLQSQIKHDQSINKYDKIYPQEINLMNIVNNQNIMNNTDKKNIISSKSETNIAPMNNISQIFMRNNMSMQQQHQFMDLQKFIVDDLKDDIESLCYKLNESGIFNNFNMNYHQNTNRDKDYRNRIDNNGQQDQESEILQSVKIRIQTLKKRIFNDCPFLTDSKVQV